MKLIKPSYEILDPIDRDAILKKIERCGRKCYKSEHKITEDSAPRFCKKIRNNNHGSVLEHVNISVEFIVNRGFTHQLVRHRHCSFSQESTRFCNYSKDRFDKNITYIIPQWYYDEIDPGIYSEEKNKAISFAASYWFCAMLACEQMYFCVIKLGKNPEESRGILPIDLKTEIVCTTNLREWKHIFELRCDKSAHPQMREIMIPLRDEFIKELPEIFEDLAQ